MGRAMCIKPALYVLLLTLNFKEISNELTYPKNDVRNEIILYERQNRQMIKTVSSCKKLPPKLFLVICLIMTNKATV